MYKLILIGVIGYLTSATGFFSGALVTFVAGDRDKRLKGAAMGFTGGLLIAFICFEILANALSISGIYTGLAGVLAGVLLTLFLEAKLKKNNISVAIIICTAIIFHSIPEGIALGSMLNHSIESGVLFAFILAIHCFPEGIAVATYLKQGKLNNRKIILTTLLLALPMSLGAFTGGALSSVSPYIFSVSLSLAGGVMLYIACGEILPDSKKNSDALTTILTSVLGFAIGSLITGKL